MTTREIWMIEDLEKRFEAFLDRWIELNEYTGCRTGWERDEMAEIANAVMERLIKFWRSHAVGFPKREP